ncbi:DUF2252 domain-containing protein [Aquipuribacter hungaricus]|uniref:DUF2252 domain-containing protein n=1 Tax=Aquipuribacter hungaricus TaxID=545624 RepID=A0ABV7WI50_9MICO
MTAPETRTGFIVDTLVDAFADLVEADQTAFRRRFRTMAKDPFSFYRGSACLFFADLEGSEDRWADDRTSRVWIQGDLHAENFGTYMDGDGALVFDVNDFDEAYLGHFTWDLQRLAASVAVLGWAKALSDGDIERLLTTYLRAYLDQVRTFAEQDRDHEWSLRLGTATGAVEGALQRAQLSTRIGLLDSMTVVEDYARRFRQSSTTRLLDDEEREVVEAGYRSYLDTVPDSKRLGSLTYELKDVVGSTGFGIGSAGLPAYRLLVEGHTQALENDVVLTMKQGAVPAVSRSFPDAHAERSFEHQGHRTAVSQRALQAHADPWLGWVRMDGGRHHGVGFVVRELSPYEADLDWSELTEPDEIDEVLDQLGRATAKVHCVSDVDDESTPLVDFQTEDAVVAVVDGREDELVAEVVALGLEHGARVREDHQLFVDAFRSGRIPGVGPGAG